MDKTVEQAKLLMKLIKLSDTHYIVVNGFEIKEGNYIYSLKSKSIFKADSIEYLDKHNLIEDFDKSFYINSNQAFKITHSTKPLEEDVEFINNTPKITLGFVNIKPLSLSEVEEAIYGYSVEKMADEILNNIQ